MPFVLIAPHKVVNILKPIGYIHCLCIYKTSIPIVNKITMPQFHNSTFICACKDMPKLTCCSVFFFLFLPLFMVSRRPNCVFRHNWYPNVNDRSERDVALWNNKGKFTQILVCSFSWSMCRRWGRWYPINSFCRSLRIFECWIYDTHKYVRVCVYACMSICFLIRTA